MIFLFVCLLEFIIMTMLHFVVNTNSNTIVTCAICVFTIIDCFAINSDRKLDNAKTPIICGLLLRVALLYFDIFGKSIYKLPNSGADSEGFYSYCLRIIANETYTSISDFPSLMSMLMRYVGTSRLNAQFIVVNFSIVSLVFTAYMLWEMNISQYVQRSVMWIICLLPNFAILGSVFLRESLVTMFVALSSYTFILWIKQRNSICFFVSIVFVVLGAIYHSGVIGMAVGFLVAKILYDRKSKTIRMKLGGLVSAAVFTIAFSYVFNNYGDVFLTKITGIESIDDIANTSGLGGSSYAAYVGNSKSIVNMIVYTPLRLVYFLFSPFPWQWRGISDIIAFVFSSLFYIYTIYMTIKQINHRQNKRRVELFLWLIIALAVTFIFAWGVSNTGTAARHRDKLIPVYSVLMASAMCENNTGDNRWTSKYIREK